MISILLAFYIATVSGYTQGFLLRHTSKFTRRKSIVGRSHVTCEPAEFSGVLNTEYVSAPLIDVRDTSEFTEGHADGATSLPLQDLAKRSYELPAPFESALRLCARDTDGLDEAKQILEAKGWTIAEAFVFKTTAEMDEKPRVVLGCEGAEYPLVVGSTSKQCWHPSPFLAEVVNTIFHPSEAPGSTATFLPCNGLSSPLPSPSKTNSPRYVIIDLGCGSGRDAVWLAQTLVGSSNGSSSSAPSHHEYARTKTSTEAQHHRGSSRSISTEGFASWVSSISRQDFAVLGVDNHEGALGRARDLAQTCGVSHCSEFVNADLRKLARAYLKKRYAKEAAADTGNDTSESVGVGYGTGAGDEQTPGDCFESLAARSFLWPLVRQAFFQEGNRDDSKTSDKERCCRVVLVHGCRFLDRPILEALKIDPLFLGWDPLVSPRSSPATTSETWMSTLGGREGALVWSTFMEGDENLAPPYRPSRRLFPGEMQHIFGASGGGEVAPSPSCSMAPFSVQQPFVLLRDDVGILNTRKTDVPASFFAAFTPRPPL